MTTSTSTSTSKPNQEFSPFMKILMNNPQSIGDKFELNQINQPDSLLSLPSGNDFYLYHYNSSNKPFFLPESNVANEKVVCDDKSSNLTKKTNIIVQDNRTIQTVVAQGFGYTNTFVIQNEDFCLRSDIERIYKYQEGTILRLWYIGTEFKDISQPSCLYNSGWIISTSNKIVGYKNKSLNDPNLTIGDIIDETFTDFFNQVLPNLNKLGCYILSLTGPETSIINHDTKRKIIYHGAFLPKKDESPSIHIFMDYNPDFQSEMFNFTDIVSSQEEYRITVQQDLLSKKDISNLGYVCHLVSGEIIKLVYSSYKSTVDMRYNTSNWKHWWYLQKFPTDTPNFTVVSPDYFPIVMPKKQFEQISEWENEYKETKLLGILFLFDEYINRLQNKNKFNNNSLTLDEEWILKTVKNNYYTDKNNFIPPNKESKFYWGGDHTRVNEYIKNQISLVWDSERGDRLYRLVKTIKSRLVSKP